MGGMIRTLIFDLGNVIVPFDFKRGYARMEGLCPYPAAQIPARLRTTDLVTRFEEGRIEPRPFVEELSRILDLRTSYDEFCEIWTSIFFPEPLIPESLLERLGEKHRLLLLSNTNAIHFEMVREAYPMLRHFDDAVLSYRVGALKPSPVVFEEAIARAECTPKECFFTDDIQAYVDAARGHGMDAVRFESREQLEAELRKREVL